MRFSRTHLAHTASKQDDRAEPSAVVGICRSSSTTAAKEEVSARRPLLIVPPRFMTRQRAQSSSRGFAASREELATTNPERDPFASPEAITPATLGTTVTPTDVPAEDTFAFAFDVDGVLIRGGNPIPEAIQAIKVLNGENEFGMRIPYIFLTNGGGKTEAERCTDLSRQLNIEVSPSQIVCGHTPMREMVEKYNTVLVIGGEGEKCRQVAEIYGFRDIVTTSDLIKYNKHTTPFRRLTPEEGEKSRKRDYSKIKIDATFVFADSEDWAGDCQIILDLAMSQGGYIGTLSETLDEGPPVYFSHNEAVWSAAHESVHLGMGALRKVVETLFTELTHGRELNAVALGKPQTGTFEFAPHLLRQWRKDEHRINCAPETIYFVGDTPESDIIGTNQFHDKAKNEWYSILVRTGVFEEGTQPRYKPMATVDTVLDAVKHGMKRELDKRLKLATKNLSLQGSAVEGVVEDDSADGLQAVDHY